MNQSTNSNIGGAGGGAVSFNCYAEEGFCYDIYLHKFGILEISPWTTEGLSFNYVEVFWDYVPAFGS